MDFSLRRSRLLRGDLTAQSALLRPLGAVIEAVFIDTCTRCSDCINACPERIIVKGQGGFPEVNFSLGACTFCGDCSRSCTTGALSSDQPWQISAEISNSCLAKQGVVCMTCKELCDELAIKIKPQLGGSYAVTVDSQRCNGCGACVKPCPVNAVQIKNNKQEA